MKNLKNLGLCLAALTFSAGTLSAAGEVVHCFTFTPIASASTADWDAYYKATSELPTKIKGIKYAWAGKLARPQSLPALVIPDAEQRKKMMADGKGNADFTVNKREYGSCMVFNDEAAFKAYADDPAHKSWASIYEKVRVPGTTTFQIVTK